MIASPCLYSILMYCDDIPHNPSPHAQAKQVNAHREKIAHLRALLSGKVSSSMPPGASQALTAAGLASVVSRAVADRTRVALRQTVR